MYSFVPIVLEILKYQDKELLQLGVFYILFPNLFLLLFLPKGMKTEGPVSPYPEGRYMIMCIVCVVHTFLLMYVCMCRHTPAEAVRHSAFLRYHIWLNLHTFEHCFNITSEILKKKPREIEHHLSDSVCNQQKGKIKVRIRRTANKAGCGACTHLQ